MKNRRNLVSALLLAPALAGVATSDFAAPTPAKPPPGIPSAAADWPQWRGPERNGVAVGSPRLLDAWPAGGPPRLWTSENIPVGGTHGWSSPVAAGGRIYIAVSVNGRDTVYCLDAGTGRTIWKRDYLGAGQVGAGVSGTVCVAGDRLYAAGANASLYCLKVADGSVQWQADGRKWWPLMPGEKGVPVLSSFLVADGIAVIQGRSHDGPHANKGGVVALDAADGRALWFAPKRGGQGSPVLWRSGGQAYVLSIARDGLSAFELLTGKPVWTILPGGSSHTPLVAGDYAVILSDGWPKRGFVCYRLFPGKAEQAWMIEGRYDAGSVPVVHQGHLYATAANRGESGGYSRATLLCVELTTGAVRWEQKTPCGGYKNPVLADGKLIYAVGGQVIMGPADPAGWREQGRVGADADDYASPAIADGRLYLRTGRSSWTKGGPGAIVCYDLRAGN